MQILSDKIEAERKFLVDVVGVIPECRELEIVQTYLIKFNGFNNRIRKITENGNTVYIKTSKKTISSYERIEKEWQITREEYDDLMAMANPNKRPIHKIRQCIPWNNLTLELDTFISPTLPHRLLEIEDVAENEQLSFPPFIKVIEEVTGNPNYYNSNIAGQ